MSIYLSTISGSSLAGQIGATGATGIHGASGINGASGVQGIDGSTGPQGPTGGASGPPGATGPQGASGIGATGLDGATGVQGASGATGAAGVNGATGLDGATGPQGATGILSSSATFTELEVYRTNGVALSSPTTVPSSASNYRSHNIVSVGSDKVVVGFIGSGSQPTLVVGTVSGESITYGTPVTIAFSSEYVKVVYEPVANKIVVFYGGYSGGYFNYAKVGTISGTSISFGTEIDIDTVNEDLLTLDAVFNSTLNKIVLTYVVYVNFSVQNRLFCSLGTVSGDSISFSTPANSGGATFSGIPRIVHDPNTDRMVIIYSDNLTGYTGKAIVASITGNTFTFGSPTAWDGGISVDNYTLGVVYDPNSQKIVISYADYTNSPYTSKTIVGTVSGTTISFGTPGIWQNKEISYTALQYDSISEKLIFTGLDADLNDRSYIGVGYVSGTSVVFDNPLTDTYYTYTDTRSAGVSVPTQDKFVLIFNDYDNSYTIATKLFQYFPTGSLTLEGVTSTGAAGIGKLVFDTDPTFSNNIIVTGNITGTNGYFDALTVNGVSVTGASGPQGASGATGIAGASGQTGVHGASGHQGASGIDGATGPQGASGASGSQGIHGASGHQGASGIDGATGPAGATGIAGASGQTGVHGASGHQGASGIDGATGPAGATGIAGASGSQGIHGASGHQGASGIDGATGPQGASGASGSQGIHGASGHQGASGATGATGIQGASGASGIRGATGATGATGIQGASGASGIGGATGATGVLDEYANNTWRGINNIYGVFNFVGLGVNGQSSSRFYNSSEVITTSSTGLTGSNTFYFANASIYYATSASTGNWTVNIKANNSYTVSQFLAFDGTSTTFVVMSTQGSTGYYCTQLSIDGTNYTPKWLNAVPTTGNTNCIDVYTYTIIRNVSGTLSVIASLAKYV